MVNRDAVAALIVTAGTGLAVGVAKLVPWCVHYRSNERFNFRHAHTQSDRLTEFPRLATTHAQDHRRGDALDRGTVPMAVNHRRGVRVQRRDGIDTGTNR